MLENIVHFSKKKTSVLDLEKQTWRYWQDFVYLLILMLLARFCILVNPDVIGKIVYACYYLQ